uniref:Uncharacterized protein n=1 Tax=mine drainage metagenome TaxID=410659 RepID=E6QX57_9ZZZZ
MFDSDTGPVITIFYITRKSFQFGFAGFLLSKADSGLVLFCTFVITVDPCDFEDYSDFASEVLSGKHHCGVGIACMAF